MDLGDPRFPQTRVFELSTVSGPFPTYAHALTVDLQGNMYIADTANSRVLRIRPDGRVEYEFLGNGRAPLVTPVSLCITGQELYVLDSSLRRIIIYDLETIAYSRQYRWGDFVGDETIHKLLSDQTDQVFFCAGHDAQRLYRIRSF
jgi:sugar lactone lactonase YvrE